MKENLKMFKNNASIEELQQELEDLSFALDNLDTTITTLNQAGYYAEEIAKLETIKAELENAIEEAEENINDIANKEQEQYEYEMSCMNAEFETNRIYER